MFSLNALLTVAQATPITGDYLCIRSPPDPEDVDPDNTEPSPPDVYLYAPLPLAYGNASLWSNETDLPELRGLRKCSLEDAKDWFERGIRTAERGHVQYNYDCLAKCANCGEELCPFTTDSAYGAYYCYDCDHEVCDECWQAKDNECMCKNEKHHVVSSDRRGFLRKCDRCACVLDVPRWSSGVNADSYDCCDACYGAFYTPELAVAKHLTRLTKGPATCCQSIGWGSILDWVLMYIGNMDGKGQVFEVYDKESFGLLFCANVNSPHYGKWAVRAPESYTGCVTYYVVNESIEWLRHEFAKPISPQTNPIAEFLRNHRSMDIDWQW